jgi:hypothetical protein
MLLLITAVPTYIPTYLASHPKKDIDFHIHYNENLISHIVVFCVDRFSNWTEHVV